MADSDEASSDGSPEAKETVRETRQHDSSTRRKSSYTPTSQLRRRTLTVAQQYRRRMSLAHGSGPAFTNTPKASALPENVSQQNQRRHTATEIPSFRDKLVLEGEENEETGTDVFPIREMPVHNKRRLTEADAVKAPMRPRRQSMAAEFLADKLKPPIKETFASYDDDTQQDDLAHNIIESVASSEKHLAIEFKNEFHKIIYNFTESRVFGGVILGVILINTAILVAQTWPAVAVRAGWYFSIIDCIFLGIYTMEMILKIYVFRNKFFHEGWNILDLSIVIVNIVDFSLPMIITNIKGFNGTAIFRLLRIFRAVRAIRALRVLRTIRFLENLQVVLGTLLQSIRSIGAIVTLITLVMYMFAVIGRGLYAKEDPKHFGNIFEALFTLFQLLTLDDWFEIHEIVAGQGRRDIIIYLFLYIVVEYFVFLNLFVAVLVDNFQLTLEAQSEANRNKKKSQEEEEDEDNFTAYKKNAAKLETVVDDHERLGERKRKTIGHFYPSMNKDERDGLEHYFLLLASLEHNNHIMKKHQRLLNVMTDICQDTQDEI